MTIQVLDISPDEYHALPHFSSTLAKTLISRSPLHAKEERGKVPTEEMDRGAVVHTLTLGRGARYKALPYDDWRTKEARAHRDLARQQGLVPIKEVSLVEYQKIADAIVRELAGRGIKLDGESEIVVLWDEPTEHGVVQCKCMMDHAWIERGHILDLKVTENAAQSAVERSAENLGYAIQAAAYTRAMAALMPMLAGRADFMFAFCEPEPPYAMNLCRGDGMFRELGERRWLRAVAEWARCTATNEWPGYGRGVNPLSPPAWALAREEFAA